MYLSLRIAGAATHVPYLSDDAGQSVATGQLEDTEPVQKLGDDTRGLQPAGLDILCGYQE
jgi:hypothetical protein